MSQNTAVRLNREAAVAAASSFAGVSYGAELGRVSIGRHTIVFRLASDQMIWCSHDTGEPVGIVSWRPGLDPRLQLAPNSRLGRGLEGEAGARIVECAVALWRAVFAGASPATRLKAEVDAAARSAAARYRKELAGVG